MSFAIEYEKACKDIADHKEMINKLMKDIDVLDNLNRNFSIRNLDIKNELQILKRSLKNLSSRALAAEQKSSIMLRTLEMINRESSDKVTVGYIRECLKSIMHGGAL